MSRRGVIAVSLAFSVSCAISTEMTPPGGLTGNPDESEIRRQWGLAQVDIACYNSHVSSIPPDLFTFVRHVGPFDCGDVKDTAGCYTTNTQVIQYDSTQLYVIRHEAKHAILHYLNNHCASAIEHNTGDGCNRCQK